MLSVLRLSAQEKIIVLVAIIAAITGLYWQYTRLEELTLQPEATPLKGQAFVEAKDGYIALAQDQDPRVSLVQLSSDIASDQQLARSCHTITHSIGQASYERFKTYEEASQYFVNTCNSGYIHGIIESHFAAIEDIDSAINTTCTSKNTTTKFAHWQCVHGIGHGVMFFTNNDLPASLTICDQIIVEHDQGVCANGVLMENFGGDQNIHNSQYASIETPNTPCADLGVAVQETCYTYAPSFFLETNPDQYKQAEKWCSKSPKRAIDSCLFGVGSQLMKDHLNNHAYIEQTCTQMNNTSLCFSGVFNQLAFQYGNSVDIQYECNKFSELYATACLESEAWFSNEWL